MIQIIHPNQFKTIPWKNGKGQTTELAISKDGTLNNFDWRLSIASVVEDGPFSDFSGYERNLILLEGNGITLTHDKQPVVLDQPFSRSRFNGASKTIGQLIDGPIKDFNLMTKQGKYHVLVESYIDQTQIKMIAKNLCFIYSHQYETVISSAKGKIAIPCGHLAVIHDESKVDITGKGLILIQLEELIL